MATGPCSIPPHACCMQHPSMHAAFHLHAEDGAGVDGDVHNCSCIAGSSLTLCLTCGRLHAWETVAWEGDFCMGDCCMETVAWQAIAWETVAWQNVAWEMPSRRSGLHVLPRPDTAAPAKARMLLDAGGGRGRGMHAGPRACAGVQTCMHICACTSSFALSDLRPGTGSRDATYERRTPRRCFVHMQSHEGRTLYQNDVPTQSYEGRMLCQHDVLTQSYEGRMLCQHNVPMQSRRPLTPACSTASTHTCASSHNRTRTHMQRYCCCYCCAGLVDASPLHFAHAHICT
eukprot:356952-Chlamydomonas_euryale.AAC.5